MSLSSSSNSYDRQVAHRCRQKIIAYWQGKGHDVSVEIGANHTISSNMVGGLPQREYYRLVAKSEWRRNP